MADTVGFFVQALIQHTIGYLVHFGVEEFSTLMIEISKQSIKLFSAPGDAGATAPASGREAPLVLDLVGKPAQETTQLLSGRGPLLSVIFDEITKTGRASRPKRAQKIVFLVEEVEPSEGVPAP